MSGPAPAARRICIVTGELAGPDYNGGIGTANLGLAQALRGRGHAVDILYTRVDRHAPFCFRGSFADQVEAFRRQGIRLACIAHGGEWNDWLAKSHRAMEHLAQGGYDLAFFNDTHGTAYYPLLARRTGSPELRATLMCVVAHSATQWIAELNEAAIETIEDVRLMELERRSIELADMVVSPSAYLLRKYRGYGWRLPEASFVRPNILPREERGRLPARRRGPVDELVFFGRLERRKGLWTFAEALDRIKYRLGGRTVTFLGKLTVEDGESTGHALLRRSAAWPFEARLLPGFDREQALGYLAGGRRLAVMPSREDNSPCVILECLQRGIPFIASGGSGGEELLAAESRADCLFQPTAAALADKLLTVLERGAVTALPAFDADRNETATLDWLAGVLEAGPRAAPAPVPPAPAPVLLVVVPPRLEAREAAARIGRLVAPYRGRVELVLLAADPAGLAAEFAGGLDGGLDGAVRIADVRSWAEIVAAPRPEDGTVAAICHLTQPIGPDWLERARRCFAAADGIAALTGLVATADAAGPETEPPFVSVPPSRGGPGGRRAVARHLVGSSPALFPLGQETNSGFVVLRAGLLPLLAASPPFDPRYGRAKRMGDWVHELLMRLHAQGRRFELVPDLALDQAVEEEPFPVFRLADVMRPWPGAAPGPASGGERALLARLASEVMLAGEKRRASADCLAHLAGKLGRRLDDPGLYADPDAASRLLAAMAQAAGQAELALELLAGPLLPEAAAGADRPTLAELVRRRARAISLIELAAEGRFQAVNLGHEWSFRLLAEERELEIHPNPAHEGRAAILFPALDLARVDRLEGAVRVAGSAARPVRFRADIVACDRSGHFSFERVVVAGGTERFAVSLPEAVRRRCNVVLADEMADPSDATRDAWARWLDPTFTAAAPGTAGGPG
ncbi:MAG TPA: glycosyltransferase family 4 protein [Geminicoccaceae bacterium]|nr:glycosyltransferase family 4 protein [Geminicoccaceae bacterium]